MKTLCHCCRYRLPLESTHDINHHLEIKLLVFVEYFCSFFFVKTYLKLLSTFEKELVKSVKPFSNYGVINKISIHL